MKSVKQLLVLIVLLANLSLGPVSSVVAHHVTDRPAVSVAVDGSSDGNGEPDPAPETDFAL